MKTPPIRKCAADGCKTFTAQKHCDKHRRPIGSQHLSTPELVARAHEDLQDRDEMMHAESVRPGGRRK